MFLKQVKVKKFTESVKLYGTPPWNTSQHTVGYRGLKFTNNSKPDDVYTVIGVTSVKEGYTERDGEYGLYFVQKNSHKVYIVAKSIGRRFKVLEADLELFEADANQ